MNKDSPIVLDGRIHSRALFAYLQRKMKNKVQTTRNILFAKARYQPSGLYSHYAYYFCHREAPLKLPHVRHRAWTTWSWYGTHGGQELFEGHSWLDYKYRRRCCRNSIWAVLPALVPINRIAVSISRTKPLDCRTLMSNGITMIRQFYASFER